MLFYQLPQQVAAFRNKTTEIYYNKGDTLQLITTCDSSITLQHVFCIQQMSPFAKPFLFHLATGARHISFTYEIFRFLSSCLSLRKKLLLYLSQPLLGCNRNTIVIITSG